MLENYYVRPATIDRIRGSWIAPAIEQYVSWLAQQRFTSRSVLHRVPIPVSFGEFAKAHGASELHPRSRRTVRGVRPASVPAAARAVQEGREVQPYSSDAA